MCVMYDTIEFWIIFFKCESVEMNLMFNAMH